MDEYEYGDTPEQIKKCLSCTKRACNNCVAKSPEAIAERKLRREGNFDAGKVLELYNEKMNDKEIADRLGTSRYRVRVWREKNNLPNHGRAALPLRQNAEKWFAQGLSDKEISELAGCVVKTVTDWRANFERV